jgi:hypothetical protein
MKNTLDAVPSSMSFVSKIETMFPTGSMKWNGTIYEKDRVIYIVFFAGLCEKLRLHSFLSVQALSGKPFESGSTAAYSQYCSSSS